MVTETGIYGESLVSLLLKLAETINAAMTYQEVLEAVAPILPDCQGVYLDLWEHQDYHRASYLEIVAAASIAEPLEYTIGHRFPKSDFPFVEVSRNERLVAVENIRTDERIDSTSRASYETAGVRAFLRVPFHREDRYIGVLFFRYDTPRQFAPHELKLALGIANLVLGAIERIHLLQETATAVEAQHTALVAEQEAREELSLLYKASEAVQAANTCQEVVQAIARLVYPVEKINLILWEHLDYRRASYFEVVAGVNLHGEATPAIGRRITPDRYPITTHVAELNQLAIEDIHTHPLVDPLSRAGWERDNIQALLITSMVRGERWHGVLSFESSVPRVFSEREQRLTLAISDLVLGAVIRIHSQQELATAVEAQRAALVAEQEAREEMAQLYQVSKAINQATDMTQVLDAIKQLFPPFIDVAIFAWEHYDRSRACYLETIASTDPNLPAGTHLPQERSLGLMRLDPTEVAVANNINGPEWASNPAYDTPRRLGMYSIADTNLIHGERVQGLFAIASYRPYFFSPQEIRLMRATAGLTAAALERFRSRQAEQEALQEREELFQASEAMNAANTFQEILEAVRHIDFDGGDLYLYVFENFDYDTASYIETVATIGERFMQRGMRTPMDNLPFLKAKPRPGLGIHENIPQSTELDEVTKATMISHGTLANLRFGLVWHGRFLGAFGVDHPAPRRYTKREIRLMVALGELVSAAVERIRLQDEMYAARERAERLAEQAQQLAALEERTHLARELHDSVSQALYGIGLGAQTAQRYLDTDPTLARESVDYILTLAQAGLAEMRALIFELRPESLESEGLVIALAKQAASLQARHQIEVKLELGEEPALTLAAKESLYRVLREALHNVIKHACASHITLKMQYVAGELWFEVIDDGVGFESNGEFPGHLGLKSMHERISQLGGTVLIDSAPGKGTHLTAKLPTTSDSPPKVG